MPGARSIQIVGGGLAGLALGIGLRRQEIPVTIFEAGHYPRHRVCGEFISGRGQASLARLDLDHVLESAGAIRATTAAFFTTSLSTPPQPLPASAICISRFILDAALVKQFEMAGGKLISGHRWADDTSQEGVVRAMGRSPPSNSGGDHWFGLKIHARNTPLTADLEMHMAPHGYVGLCRLAGDEVNVCGLFRRRPGEHFTTQQSLAWLHGLAGSPLQKRLATAEFDQASLCSVAGLSMRPHSAAAHSEICVGDAITMIPPVTGNGMSMAFESAELAIKPVAAWSRGEMTWDQAHQTIAQHCDRQFASRLKWAKWMQRLLLMPALQNPVITLLSRHEWLWRKVFELTR